MKNIYQKSEKSSGSRTRALRVASTFLWKRGQLGLFYHEFPNFSGNEQKNLLCCDILKTLT